MVPQKITRDSHTQGTPYGCAPELERDAIYDKI